MCAPNLPTYLPTYIPYHPVECSVVLSSQVESVGKYSPRRKAAKARREARHNAQKSTNTNTPTHIHTIYLICACILCVQEIHAHSTQHTSHVRTYFHARTHTRTHNTHARAHARTAEQQSRERKFHSFILEAPKHHTSAQSSYTHSSTRLIKSMEQIDLLSEPPTERTAAKLYLNNQHP